MPLTTGLPRTDDLRLPPLRLQSTLRPTGQALFRLHWDIAVRGSENVPRSGPVVIAANHIGFADGPLLAAFSPRPVHVLTKKEMFTGAMGRFLSGVGQIPVERHITDMRAVRMGIRVLRAGHLLGVFPEANRGGGEMHLAKPGAAYFAMVTGARVVPLVYLGTRLPGGNRESVPPRGSRMALSFGPPLDFGQHGWPRRHDELTRAGEEVRRALVQLIEESQAATGLALPGALPEDLPHPDGHDG
ncbi:MAG: lysophospholipid acyltransferase family protein [Marmoricola sp.]